MIEKRVACFLILFAFLGNAPAQTARRIGSFDPTFGDGGIVRTPFTRAERDEAIAVAVQSDGKVVVAADAQQSDGNPCAVARFLPNGKLDVAFGNGGQASVPGLAKINAIAVADSGHIVLAGYQIPGDAPDGRARNFCVARLNADGSPDATFAGIGYAAVAFAPDAFGNAQANALLLQADGKIIAAGEKNHIVMARFRPDGTLDPTFGARGQVETLVSTFSRAATMLRLSNGKILVGGATSETNAAGQGKALLLRYSADGALDTAFGQQGKTITALSDGDSGFSTLATQGDGKIIAAGLSKIGDNTNIALARYDANGKLDATFSDDGKAFAEFAVYKSAVAVQVLPDGKILVAGSARHAANNADLALARFNADGSPDTTFGEGGKLAVRFGDDAAGQQDGINATLFGGAAQLLAAGFTGDNKNRDSALARYDASGAPDGSWGKGGLVSASLGVAFGLDKIHDIALQSDGKIVATGVALQHIGYESLHGEVALVRYAPNGALDTSFGEGGKVLASVAPAYSQATQLALQSDGKIVVFGTTENLMGVQKAFLMRFLPDGAVDAAFGKDGHVFLKAESVNCFALQGDGKIIVAGSTYLLPNNDFLLARFNADGTPDASFGDGGQVTTDVLGGGDAVYALAVQDDKIVAAGVAVTNADGAYHAAVARYDATGNLDATFGSGGRFTSSSGSVIEIAVQPDGKLLLAHGQFGLTRLQANGKLDKTFGNKGHAAGIFDEVALQSDGKIVGLGHLDRTIRLLPEGALDATFGINGSVKADFDAKSYDDSVVAMAVAQGGKIIVAGTLSDDFALARCP